MNMNCISFAYMMNIQKMYSRIQQKNAICYFQRVNKYGIIFYENLARSRTPVDEQIQWQFFFCQKGKGNKVPLSHNLFIALTLNSNKVNTFFGMLYKNVKNFIEIETFFLFLKLFDSA